MKTNKIMGREPAVFFLMVAALLLSLIKFIPFTIEVAGALNGVVLLGAGLATAAFVDTDKVLPRLLGLVQGVFAVFLAYGSPLPESLQTGILGLIAAGAAFFVRTQVTAPVTAGGGTVHELTAAAYHGGYQAGQDDLVMPPDTPALPVSGSHADSADFTGELPR